MNDCVLSTDVFMCIAEYDYTIYGALIESCKQLNHELPAMNPWRIFIQRHYAKSGTGAGKIVNMLTSGKVFTQCLHHQVGGGNVCIYLYKGDVNKITINILQINTYGVAPNMSTVGARVADRLYRVNFHHVSRNELVWADAEYCRHLIAAYGFADAVNIE